MGDGVQQECGNGREGCRVVPGATTGVITTQSDNKILKISEDLGVVQQSVAELSVVASQVGGGIVHF